MPPWPIAMPSSTAIVLNSRGIPPASLTAAATTWATSRRCTWPGTNSVKLLAIAMIGLPKSSRSTPVARSRARAPAMFLPWVTVRDLSGGMGTTLSTGRCCAPDRTPPHRPPGPRRPRTPPGSPERSSGRCPPPPAARGRREIGPGARRRAPAGGLLAVGGWQRLLRRLGDPFHVGGRQDRRAAAQVGLGPAARVDVDVPYPHDLP